MNKSAFAVTAVALVLSLIGLVYFAVIAPTLRTRSDHFITVWVQTDGRRPTIHVSAPELHKHGQDQVIFWDLDNTGVQSYKFPDNGIAFMAGDGGTGIFNCQKQNDSKFKCKDPTGAMGKYKYTVTLVGSPQPDPLPVNPLDPWIYNE